jgi:hypothetical protein
VCLHFICLRTAAVKLLHFNFTVFPKCVDIPGRWFHSISHLTFEEAFIESYLLCLCMDFVASKSKNSLC